MPRSREILLPRDSQPQEAAELAGSNFSWVGTSLQAVDGSALAQAGNVFTRGATPAGVGYNITTAASGALTHAVPTRSGAQPFTIVHQIYSAGRAFDWHTIFVVGTRFVEVREESGGKLQVYVNGAYQIETSSSIFGTPGTYTIGITYDGATASLVLNGVLIGTYASTNLGSATSTPYKIGDDYWQYAKVCTHTFAHYLTEARSVPWLVDATRNPWQLFAPQAIPVPVSAGGGGTTISATPGNAAADGTTASVKRTIPATPGNASASGTTASVIRVIGAAPGNAVADGTTAAVTRSIAATPGNAVADGVTATVTNSGTTTISCTPGNAAADGALAAITRTIAAAPGNAVANGAIAALLRVIATTPGNAVADGVTAAVQASVTISCTPGNAVADGVAATVTAAVSQLDLILKILVNRQELNPATGTFTLYDDDATTVLYTTNAWADAAGTVPYSGGALRRIDALI